ncbi:hypothetical protein C0V75_01430 [Tabrizicola sp. TH137]|uniref:hypothetical protein n=1 Tax=Tabrizicola sp. TH137 TaxID=2067452 RepID=UPI000C7966DE|nr:hypothetical protein [Tabrizicola sp. TH137]PLL14141.1 hypothetical protein C0V75_01430 [Tabrizicola sp. TH137]
MWRGWVWRVAVLSAGVTAGYFAATVVLPLSTRGDPIYDTAMLRARWYGDLGVVWCHLAALLGALVLLAAGPRRGWCLAALLAGGAALAVIVVEEGLVIRYGDLIEPRSLAEWRLTASRWTTAALSGGMVFALWRARDAR